MITYFHVSSISFLDIHLLSANDNLREIYGFPFLVLERLNSLERFFMLNQK